MDVNARSIIEWATDRLASLRYTQTGMPQDIQITPWSDIKAIPTDHGMIYLKHTSPAFALEPFLTQTLHEQFQAHVPKVLDINAELNCFLMENAGVRLREYQPVDFGFDHKAIQYYQDIQQTSENHLENWVAFGIPDWRLENLPDLYEELIDQEDFLTTQGVTEFTPLRKLTPALTDLCEQLSQMNILQTLDHCDFHERNVLIHPETQAITIIDWAEVVITHPYFSWINYLKKSTYAPTDLFTPDPKAWELAQKIWPVYAVLAFHRLMQASDPRAFKIHYADRPNRIAGYLQDWLNISL